MEIPVYVVCGLLDAGKSSVINTYLDTSEDTMKKRLVIQVEEGDRKIRQGHLQIDTMFLSPTQLETRIEQAASLVEERIRRQKPDELIIEWNGLLPFSSLEQLVFETRLKRWCRETQVIYVADMERLLPSINRLGVGPVSQIQNADLFLYRNLSERKQLKKLVGSQTRCMEITDPNWKRAWEEEKEREYLRVLKVISILLIVFLLYPVIQGQYQVINEVLLLFLGLFLQGIPFLLIGVLLSSVIQVFVSRETLRRWFPKSKLKSMLVALFAGMMLPVCDCASIPIFKSLVRKGVPIYAAVTFMMAAPILNPVVIFSTYYAFHSDGTIVLLRCVLGMIAAMSIGLVMAKMTKREELEVRTPFSIACSCGCMEEKTTGTRKEKLLLVLSHSQMEFLDVLRYLLFGTLISAVFQVIEARYELCVCDFGGVVNLLIMMAFAFCLSLCSSADAVVAKSFLVEFPLSAVMGFLVFGPMLDIKNLFLLRSGFQRSFIIKLSIVTALICFIVVLVATLLQIGGLVYE